MWALFFCALAAVGGGALLYLRSRLRKLLRGFGLMEGKWGSLAALGLLVFGGALSWWTLGAVNTVVIALHLAVIWFVCDLAGLVRRRLANKRPEEADGAAPARSVYVEGLLALGITAVYLGFGWYQAHHVWATHYSIETETGAAGMRIVFFADAHVGALFSGEDFAAYVQEMQEEQPDLVVIGGDFVDDDTSREDMEAACRALGEFQTTYGVYYVYGNHDKGYFGDGYRGYSAVELAEALRENGVTILEDETVALTDSLYLTGRQDATEAYRAGRAGMQSLAEGLDAERFWLVADHQPVDYEEQEAAGADLVLSGHTHGGQILPLQWMMGMNDQVYGLETRGGSHFLVTSGLGDWAMGFKTGCRSEYVVIDLVEK